MIKEFFTLEQITSEAKNEIITENSFIEEDCVSHYFSRTIVKDTDTVSIDLLDLISSIPQNKLIYIKVFSKSIQESPLDVPVNYPFRVTVNASVVLGIFKYFSISAKEIEGDLTNLTISNFEIAEGKSTELFIVLGGKE